MKSSYLESAPTCFADTITHLHFETCLDRLRELVRMKTSTRLVIVTGPTGVGKSTLVQRVCEELAMLAAPDMQSNPEIVAYGRCSIKAPGPTAFSWKDTYIQMLRSLHHPFAEFRTLGKVNFGSDDTALRPMSPEAVQRLSNDRLFRVVQRTIMHRQPKAVIFDEAHHLLRVGSSQTLINQLEHLKYIADETATLHILFGTYEVIKLMDLSSALIRRREVIHFPRYIYDPEDAEHSLEEFAKVVAVFAEDLDRQSKFSLLTIVPYLYQGSVGCVGVLRDWLFRAFHQARQKRDGLITQEVLESTILASSDRLELVKDAVSGEAYFARRSQCEEEYLWHLGFMPDNARSESPPPDKTDKPKPFRRNPHNDPVGLQGLILPDAKAS